MIKAKKILFFVLIVADNVLYRKGFISQESVSLSFSSNNKNEAKQIRY